MHNLVALSAEVHSWLLNLWRTYIISINILLLRNIRTLRHLVLSIHRTCNIFLILLRVQMINVAILLWVHINGEQIILRHLIHQEVVWVGNLLRLVLFLLVWHWRIVIYSLRHLLGLDLVFLYLIRQMADSLVIHVLVATINLINNPAISLILRKLLLN